MRKVRFIVVLLWVFTNSLVAENAPNYDVAWVQNKTGQGLAVQISLVKSLSKKQSKTLDSGFSTFSRLVVFNKKNNTTVGSVSCSVKYDLWDERYNIVLLGRKPESMTVNTFNEYSAKCLRFVLQDEALIEKYKKEGATLNVMFQIEQISSQQANKVKEWLVKQQSGLIAGLFAHMLGDMTLSESNSWEVKIPPKP